MSDRDYEIDEWAKCASCDEGVEKLGAFYDPKTRDYFHPECAGVERCSYCGEFEEEGILATGPDGLKYHPKCLEGT